MYERFQPKISSYDQLKQIIDDIPIIRVENKSVIRDNFMPSKIIAIGDIHGDYEKLYNLLFNLHLIDSNIRWTGGNTYLIQMGDILDDGGRGNDRNKGEHSADEIAIYSLLINLHEQAKEKGGNVLICVGNHELLNIVNNNYRYVNTFTKDYFINNLQIMREDIFNPNKEIQKIETFESEYKPRNELVYKLSRILKVVIKFANEDNKIYFCHGGLPNRLALKRNNIDDYFNKLNSVLPDIINGNTQRVNKEYIDIINDITWNRFFSIERNKINNTICNRLDDILGSNARLVVGHTPQSDGINSVCDNRIFRIDTAISDAFGTNNKLECLEIINGERFHRIQLDRNNTLKKSIINSENFSY